MLSGRQELGVGICWTFTIAATIAVSLRLFSRLKLDGVAGWDDAVIVLALLVYITTNAFNSVAISYGAGLHLATLAPQDAIEAGKWTVVSDAVGLFSFTLPKLSVAILLTRIITVGRLSLSQAVIILAPAVFLVLFSFAALGVWLGQCSPTEALWNPLLLVADPNAHCLQPYIYKGIGIALGSCSALADFFYAIYPIFFISKLQTPTKRKVHLTFMLGLGIVGGAAAIWKTASFPATSEPHADVTYAAVSLSIANIVEAGVLIIAACVPTIGPAVRFSKHIWARTKASRGGSSFIELSDGYGSSRRTTSGRSVEPSSRRSSEGTPVKGNMQYELRDV